ncbi:MAG TPA: DUF3325 domain-containing protein [Rhodanobacter sp.]|nr:DUF3325 domain-containing protein [Rhodanobacter sp.]
MSESVLATCLLSAAWLASVAGMGWLAVSLPVHAQQVWERIPASAMTRLLRCLGVAGIVAALALCLAADHASMAVLVWVMSSTGASLLVAFTLAWRPRWLRLLAPWV